MIPFNPIPAVCSAPEAKALVASAFSGSTANIIADLLRPTIRVWPKSIDYNLNASRFGGLPSVPVNWQWPGAIDDRFVFLGQIDCSEVQKAVGASALPDSGLLSFFGDTDDIIGSFPSAGGLIYHFRETRFLRLADESPDQVETLIQCGLSFCAHTELPHPRSRAALTLDLSREERGAYEKLSNSLLTFGLSPNMHRHSLSKLLGWPDLVQDDRHTPFFPRSHDPRAKLLLQMGEYHDGTQLQYWGPGGLIYFRLFEDDLISQNFSAAEMEVQCT